MSETAGALDKLYSMLREADQLGLSRSARLRLIGIIGSLENEELDRYRRAADMPRDADREGTSERGRRFNDEERVIGHSRY